MRTFNEMSDAEMMEINGGSWKGKLYKIIKDAVKEVYDFLKHTLKFDIPLGGGDKDKKN